MSCGRPHATPCEVVLAHLVEFLEAELDTQTAAVITAHLEECPPCTEHMPVDVVVQTLLASSCCQERAPERVRTRIEAMVRQWVTPDGTVTVTQTRVTTDYERGAE